MPKRVTPPPVGIVKLAARLQQLGVTRGFAGRSSGWFAVAVAAWGFRRVHRLAARDVEVLIREPIAPGERMLITQETTTWAEYTKAQKKQKRLTKELAHSTRKADKQARQARRGLSRKERALVDATND